MRSRPLSIALLAMYSLVAPAFCHAQQSAPAPISGDPNDQLATIAGTVVSANTGEPLKKAHVILFRKGGGEDDTNQHPLDAVTDATGHFSIDKIPTGSYDLMVYRSGFLKSQYGQDQPDKPGATLTIAAGQKISDLLFRLRRTGIITGRVQDEDGEPVRGVNVTSYLHSAVRGKPKDEPTRGDRTNDLGEYRIADLAPGRYIILATPSGDLSSRGTYQHPEEYLPTYYSGTTDAARASAIEVKSGDELSGIDFVFTPRPAIQSYKVRGHIVNSVPDEDGRFLVLLASPGDRNSGSFSGKKQAVADRKTGNFEFKDVPPGEYVAIALTLGSGGSHFAEQNVNVTAADVDGVSLVVTRGIDVSVRVGTEGKLAPSAADIEVSLEPTQESVNPFRNQPRASGRPDGSLIIKEVNDGSYSVRAYSKCQECYLKSATSNGVDLLAQGMQITGGAGPSSIAVVYSSNSGKLSGAVINKDELPAPGAMVVLVPDAALHQTPEEYKTSTTDQYGHFEIRGIPPGHYKAFAWEKVTEDSYGDPAFLQPVENMAESFDIGANEQKSVQLKMIPASDPAN